MAGAARVGGRGEVEARAELEVRLFEVTGFRDYEYDRREMGFQASRNY